MTRILSFLLIVFGTCIGLTAKGQVITFQETALFNRHHTGYSILTDTSGGRTQYLMAGTMLEPGQADSTDVHVVYTDDIGTIIWQKTYDTGENERCLNVVHDSTGFVMTGYVDTMGAAHQVFVLRIDGSGNVVDQRRFESPFSGLTHGLGIQRTQDDGYVLTGFIADGYAIWEDKRAFVLKMDANLNPTWSRYINTPWSFNRDLDMGESIVEIPGQGYFVTGSMNIPRYQFSSSVPNFTDQGVLAVMLDLNGNVLWNTSFAAQDSVTAGQWNVGVKPYFDAGSNLIYLMSNNAQAHQFNITVFDLAGNIVNDWDYSFLLNGIAGFDLIESGNPNTLVACGVAVFYDFLAEGGWSSYNYPPVLLEFNKTDGSMVWSNLYKFPSEYYGSFPNGFFTPIPGEQPELFTPDMVTRAPDGGYAIAAYRSNASSFYDLELIKTDQQGHTVCPYDTLDFVPISRVRYVSDSLTVTSGFTAAPVVFVPGTLPYTTVYCADPDTCICDVIPNYSVTTTDSCTYQFTDLSYVDSCFSICSWHWDFGDGTYSSAQNPTHTYDTIGWHFVCLSVVVCGDPGVIECEDLICQDLYVSCDTCLCEIEPDFSIATNDSCTFQFMDLSVVDTCYDICEWSWDFGDGNTSTSQNPIHTYSAISAGWQTVCLHVTACDIIDPASPTPLCDTIICQQVYVGCDTCLCEIDPAFSFSTQDSCTYQFTDQSVVDTCFSICTWDWDFGDGNTSTAANPSHTYNSVGWQTVCLQVSACTIDGTLECDTFICQDIYVNCDTCECEIIPGFGYAVNYDSCSVSFTDQSHMADTCYDIWAWSWDLGDGNNSNTQNPTHTYSSTGWYTVCQTLYAGSAGTVVCDTTFCQDIYVECDTCICDIDPAFSYTIDHDSCIVCFEDETVVDTCMEIVGQSWDLGNGAEVGGSSPCQHYSVNGIYTICLTVTAVANGVVCDSTICEDIDIYCCDSVNGIGDYYGPPMDVLIYPNPFSEMTTIKLSRNLVDGRMILYDLTGRKVDELTLHNSIGKLNRNNLSNGMYSLVILEDGKVVFKGKIAVH